MRELIVELGRYDSPQDQKQDNYRYDLLKNNLAIFGSSMSGKTTLLKTLLLRIHQSLGLTDEEEIYILDFGNGLKRYEKLPYVLGYFNASREENVRRVFKILDGKLSENMRKLQGVNYSEAPKGRQPSHVTFLLDGFSSFMAEERYTIYQEILKKLAREGLSKGITIVLAASESGGFARIASSFGRIIAFDMPKDRYGEVFSRKVEKPINKPGRGMVNIDTAVYEFQAYLPVYVPKTGRNTDNAQENAEEKMIRMMENWILLHGSKYDQKLLETNLGLLEEKELRGHVLLDRNIVPPESVKTVIRNHAMLKDYRSRAIKILPEEKLFPETWSHYYDIPFKNEKGDFSAGLDYYSLEPVPRLDPPSLNLKEAQTIAIYGKKEFGKSNLLKLLLEAANEIPETRFCFWEDGRQALTKPEGLRKTIEGLHHKEFVTTKEEFFDYLSHCGFLEKDNPDTNPERMGEFEETRKIHAYESQFEQRRKELLAMLDLWDECWETELREKREQRQEEDLETSNWAEQEREAHEHNMKERRLFIDNLLNLCFEMGREMEPARLTEENQETVPENALTVIVIQSRLFYQTSPRSEWDHPAVRIASALGKCHSPMLFVFSDVQRIDNSEVRTYFNSSIRYAFLLDDIVRFVTNKGQRSVFDKQDPSELKEQFGPCELGDGFFLDVDRDELLKLKFLYSSPAGEEKEREEHG